MKPVARTLANRLRNLNRDRDGVAIIEFAFIAPVFLTLIVAGVELSNYALAHLRVSQLAMTVADDAGRVNVGVDEANIYEVFAGADVIGESLDFEDRGRIVLSSLEDNGRVGDEKGQMIRWQRCWGDLEVVSHYGDEGKGKNDNALENGMGRGNKKITAGSNTALMFVEVTYRHKPILLTAFFKPKEIRYESAFNVRGRQNNAITNSRSLEVMDCELD